MQILMQAAQGQQNGTIQEFSVSKSDIFFKVLDNKLFYFTVFHGHTGTTPSSTDLRQKCLTFLIHWILSTHWLFRIHKLVRGTSS